MSVADTVLGPVVWGVPAYSFTLIGKLRRQHYCSMQANKLRVFFLGMLASDSAITPDDKAGYYIWLEKVNWATFLAKLHDVARWKNWVEKESDPIDAALLQGVNSEYQRLFRCFKDGFHPYHMGVI